MKQDGAKVTGVVLAGGRARRMGGGDKGLVLFRGRPLVAYAVDALKTLTDRIVINANRNFSVYRAFGYPVVSDATAAFDGPLAGILSAMRVADTPYVLTVPCDSPLVGGEALRRLWETALHSDAEICVAHDGERLHPVFLVLKCSLSESLSAYLASGQRKIDGWLNQHGPVLVAFGDTPDIFRNINTAEELAGLEACHG